MEAEAPVAGSSSVCLQKGALVLWDDQDTFQFIMVLLAGQALQHGGCKKDVLGNNQIKEPFRAGEGSHIPVLLGLRHQAILNCLPGSL